MTCTKCNDTYYVLDKTQEDTWVPCSCLLLKRWNDVKIQGIERIEVTLPEIDLVLVGEPIERLKPLMNQLIWQYLEKDIDAEVAFAYSGDMASAFLNNESVGSWMKDFEAPDILFIYLVIGEATGKLVGRVVNQIYDFRKNEGLRTIFVSPYGGIKLQKRYQGDEDQMLGFNLAKIREIPI